MTKQNTIAKIVECDGIGLHSGEKASLRLIPAKENSGICFIRTDIVGFNREVKADYRNVSKTTLGTTLSNDDGTMVSTVEHLMAALWGCNIDNLIVEVNSPEIPIMDGSSEPFVFLLECAGKQPQKEARKYLQINKEIIIEKNGSFAKVSPSDNFSIDLEIDFANDVIKRQKTSYNETDISFKMDLCRARTFGFKEEVEMMRKAGLARGGSLENAIVLSGDKVLNKGGLRYNNEFVRHKILDCIGDFYLAGAKIKGAFSCFKSGHYFNNYILKNIFADRANYSGIH